MTAQCKLSVVWTVEISDLTFWLSCELYLRCCRPFMSPSDADTFVPVHKCSYNCTRSWPWYCMGRSSHFQAPAALSSGKEPNYQLNRRLVSPSGILNVLQKITISYLFRSSCDVCDYRRLLSTVVGLSTQFACTIRFDLCTCTRA